MPIFQEVNFKDFRKSKNIKKVFCVSNAGQMGKRIMKSFTKYIYVKVGLGPGQKLTVIQK